MLFQSSLTLGNNNVYMSTIQGVPKKGIDKKNLVGAAHDFSLLFYNLFSSIVGSLFLSLVALCASTLNESL